MCFRVPTPRISHEGTRAESISHEGTRAERVRVREEWKREEA